MADRFFTFHPNTPAGTAITAPLITTCAMPVCIVRHITVKVPPGPSGHLRFQICVNGTSVIPENGTEWYTPDNDTLEFDVVIAPESGAWQVKSYNTGIYPHQVEVRFAVDLPPDKGLRMGTQPLAL